MTAATKATLQQLTRRWCGVCDNDLVAATAGGCGLGALKSEWDQSQCEVKKGTALGLLPYLGNYFRQTQINGPQSIDNKGFPKECFLSENSVNNINIFDGILFAKNFRWKLILFRQKWFCGKNSVDKCHFSCSAHRFCCAPSNLIQILPSFIFWIHAHEWYYI